MRGQRVSNGASERGSIIVALLLVMCLSAVVMSSLMISTVEYELSANTLREAQAFAFSDSGIEYGLHMLREPGVDANGDPIVVNIDALLLGDDGTANTDDDGLLLDAPLIIADGGFWIQVVDNDDGDGDPFTDLDGSFRLGSTGFSHNSGRRTWVELSRSGGGGSKGGGPNSFVTNGALEVGGHTNLYGSGGVLHSNTELVLKNRTTVEGVVTSSGALVLERDLMIGGELLDTDAEKDAYIATHSNVGEIEVPQVDPREIQHLADYKLGADGKVRDNNDNVVFDASDDPFNGWVYKGSHGWVLGDVEAADFPPATYYVQGDAKIDRHSGTPTEPLRMTLIAEGTIEIKGHTYLNADTPDLLLVAGGDLRMSGHSESGFEYDGAIFVHEQISLHGHTRFRGAIWVENAEDEHSLVSENGVHGHVDVLAGSGAGWPGGGGGDDSFTVITWHEEPMGNVSITYRAKHQNGA